MPCTPSRVLLAALFSASLSASLTLAPQASAQHPSRSASTSPTIPQVAKTAGQFTTLLAAVDAAGLTQTLLGRGPFTLFAPTDEAFKRLPNGTVAELLKPENREKLRTILTYHVVAGRVTAAQARTVRTAETVADLDVRISDVNGELRINDATVRIADIPASNGIIHVIDRVLLPPDARASESASVSASGSATSLIDYAIDRGAPLYNDGQPASTVAIYEVVASALLAFNDREVPDEAKRGLRAALRESRGTPRERAVALRRALDSARQMGAR
ncbi:fasciclin domain-containing protein [Gemmatimonas groenlandica]|uniref:Fasciclin domain-containing protein n=1 Tax=Gemmatimonas groenlandica TaxID=2732249 RepID=A0A6M4ISG5_9BACT|nr:fasciclin domain-containing protein [Gemmatimonas groenlandica]QJR36396.1 fasciclin domain-containing protein [Gemmatimonas groenlandica]